MKVHIITHTVLVHVLYLDIDPDFLGDLGDLAKEAPSDLLPRLPRGSTSLLNECCRLDCRMEKGCGLISGVSRPKLVGEAKGDLRECVS